MPNPKYLLSCLILVALIALEGCFPGVYKIDIQQGNVVTQDMIDELRPGMSKAQVRYIMGNPLITDTFHAKRWDYLYSLQVGGGKKSQKRMSLYFNEQDQLIAVSGDFRLKPGQTRDDAIFGEETTEKPPVTVETDELEASSAVEQPLATQDELQTPESVPLDTSSEASVEPEAPSVEQSQPLADHHFPADTQSPDSVEEQIQRELDAVQPAEQGHPDLL